MHLRGGSGAMGSGRAPGVDRPHRALPPRCPLRRARQQPWGAAPDVSLAGDIVRALREDPEALAQLREALGAGEADRSQVRDLRPAYTVATLAAEIGRTERSIRGAIARGELEAVKRGRGYTVPADAVAAWAAAGPRANTNSPRPTARPRRSVMRDALRP